MSRLEHAAASLILTIGCYCWYGCGTSTPSSDTTTPDSIPMDVVTDSGLSDAVETDEAPETTTDTKPDDICGPVDVDSEHVEGQPCEIEGESYCIDTGSYEVYIPAFSWQCIRPGFIKCTWNPLNDSLIWQKSDCEDLLTPLGRECGFQIALVNCSQTGSRASCCPWTANTYGAGGGAQCSRDDVGTTRCGQGDYRKSSLVRTCNFLDQARAIYPKDPADPLSSGPSSDKCDYVFAECPYWYYSEQCPAQENCFHSTACESGTNEYGDPTNVCAGACIYDNVQDKDRCATTCQDLFAFYQD